MQKYLEKLSKKINKSPIYNQNNIIIVVIFLFVVIFANHFFKDVVIYVIKAFNREGYECKVDIGNSGQKKRCFKQTLTESKSIIKDATDGYNMIKQKLSLLEKRADKVMKDADNIEKGNDGQVKGFGQYDSRKVWDEFGQL